MKTNDIKITQRAEYYYTAIDLFQTVHQNRSVLGVLGCKADAQKLLRLVGLGFFFCLFLMLALAFFASWRRLCHCRIAQVLPAPACAPATTLCMVITDFILPFAWGFSGDKNISMRILA